MDVDIPKELDEQLIALKTRPYTKRQCKCPNCESGDKVVGLSGRKLHNCDWPGCNKIFDDASRLLVHMHRHKGLREFICNWPGCGREFFRKDHLNGHFKSHTGENITCKLCGFKASGKSSLSTHMSKFHEKKVKCSCPNCKAPQAKKVVGPDGRKLHMCHYEGCDRVFDAISRLQIHIQRHIGERTYSCLWEDCDRKFYRKDHLKTHILTGHTKQGSYVCPVCEYKFALKSSLLSHMKIHEIRITPPISMTKGEKIEVKEPKPIRIIPNGSCSSNQPAQVQEPEKIQLKKSDRSAFEEIKHDAIENNILLQMYNQQAWHDYIYLVQHYQHLYSQYQIQSFQQQPPVVSPGLYRPW